MNEHDATEISFNNGYKQGKADGAREIFEEIGRYNRPPLPECEPVYVLRKRELDEIKKKFDCEV